MITMKYGNENLRTRECYKNIFIIRDKYALGKDIKLILRNDL